MLPQGEIATCLDPILTRQHFLELGHSPVPVTVLSAGQLGLQNPFFSVRHLGVPAMPTINNHFKSHHLNM